MTRAQRHRGLLVLAAQLRRGELEAVLREGGVRGAELLSLHRGVAAPRGSQTHVVLVDARDVIGRAWRAILFAALVGLAARWLLGNARSARRAPGRSEAPRERDDAGGGDSLSDSELVARVRERAAIPAGVEVAVAEGALVLFGRVARHALVPLLQRVSRIDGVSLVENRLTPIDARFHEPPA